MFNKKDKNSIFSLAILAISAMALIFYSFPTTVDAQYNGYYDYYSNGSSYSYGTGSGSSDSHNSIIQAENPVPYIVSITPDSVTAKSQIIKVTINGNGFVYSSTVRFNGSPRTVTYISPNRLVVQLNEADVSTPGRRYLTVINDTPGGGFSNPVPFVVNNTVSTSTTSQNSSYNSNAASALTGYESMNSNSFSEESYNNYENQESYASLTANAIVGSPGFLPTGILQWIILVILILTIIFIWRKFFGGENKYHASPMKHV